MTLGHTRLINEIRPAAGSLPPQGTNPSSPFDPQLFSAQLLDQLGGDPEARLGKSLLKELKALSLERDAELFWEGALNLAHRLEREDCLDASASLYQGIFQATEKAFPEMSRRAEQGMKAMAGTGEGGARFEFLLRRFAREAGDPSMIAAFGAGSLAFRATKFVALSQLWSSGQGVFLGRTGAGLLASVAGLSAEAPAFLFTSKLGRQLGGAFQDWRGETLAHELAGVAITLSCLKSAGALSGKAVKMLDGVPLPQGSWLGRFARAIVPQTGMLGGIVLARRGEEALGLRPRLNDATLLTDSLATYFQFLVGGRLAERVMGPKFHTMQSEWNWRATAAARPGVVRGSSTLDLTPAPLLSGSYDDGGDGHSPGPGNRRFGYGKDTVMGKWFPTEAKPSNAVPMFTSSFNRIPIMLRSAYRYRPDRQHPRTILLEPGLEALQKISPAVPVTAELLNSLTRDLGSQFPERTPFRILQVAERRTFTAKVSDRNLLWTEEGDPTWARVNRHSVSAEFEAETPLEIYLYIESLARQQRPSCQTDYRVRYQGPSPASYEVSLVKFIERSLKFYRIAGRSFRLEFEDGGVPSKFTSLTGDWTIEESVKAALAKPPAAGVTSEVPVKTSPAPRPTFPTHFSPSAVKKSAPVAPFAVITSIQGLKDVATLLSDRSIPRRIELWLEASSSSALFDAEIWQHTFKDLRPGSVLVVHDKQTRESHTFQRREDQVRARSSQWNQPLAWEPGIPLSSRDVMDLFQQLQFLRSSKLAPDQPLTVSILGDWEPTHGKLLVDLLNQWNDIPFGKIEIRAARPRSEVWLRLQRNHRGKFEIAD